MNFLIFLDFFRIFNKIFKIFRNQKSIFLIKNQFSEFDKRASDVAQSGVSDRSRSMIKGGM